MILILDNGGYTCKVGYSTDAKPHTLPNSIFKTKAERRTRFVSSQIIECKDLSGLYYQLPLQKGFLVDWGLERQIWDHIFSKEVLNVDFGETELLLTEPHFNFSSIRKATAEVVFEEYQFKGFYSTPASSLSASSYMREKNCSCCIVLDCGFSCTNVVPYCHGRKIVNAIKRIDVGGKLLTNHLKDLISYRQLNVMDETYVVNQLKEDACFVSNNFLADMEIAKNGSDRNAVSCDYVLPDFQYIKRGYIQHQERLNNSCHGDQKSGCEEQIVRLQNERFAVPEIMFNPSDIGINQVGASESIVHSINLTPSELQTLLYRNIILTGGNIKLPGFKERVYSDVRALTNADMDIGVFLPDDPVSYAWECGADEVRYGSVANLFVSRKEYEEFGYTSCQKVFC